MKASQRVVLFEAGHRSVGFILSDLSGVVKGPPIYPLPLVAENSLVNHFALVAGRFSFCVCFDPLLCSKATGEERVAPLWEAWGLVFFSLFDRCLGCRELSPSAEVLERGESWNRLKNNEQELFLVNLKSILSYLEREGFGR